MAYVYNKIPGGRNMMYLEFLKRKLMSRLAYRKDFIFDIVSSTIWSLLQPLFILLVYGMGAEYPGWSFNEMLVFLGFFNLLVGLNKSIFRGFFKKVEEYVREGKLELVLVKPISEIYYLLGKGISFENLGQTFTGIVVLIAGMVKASLDPNLFIVILFSLSAFLLYFSFILLSSSFAIKYVMVSRLLEIIDVTFEIGDKPMNIFPRFIELAFGVFFPLFLMSYYPASAMLGFEIDYIFIPLISTVVVFITMLLYWKYTLTTYTGASG